MVAEPNILPKWGGGVTPLGQKTYLKRKCRNRSKQVKGKSHNPSPTPQQNN